MNRKFVSLFMLILLVGSSLSSKVETFSLRTYTSEHEALKNLISEYQIKGPLYQLVLERDNTLLLLTVVKKGVYSVGEIVEEEGKYSAYKLSSDVNISTSLSARWEFRTLEGEFFTISISKDKQSDTQVFFENLPIYASIFQGQVLNKREAELTNILRSYILKNVI
ncbi:hypothetical protein E5161_17065 [Cohnella pontilimi]|uniref:Uncharacterized protein n=2 Tax=Cohnella pontilimi TaxID=2564100 RepID=A0A4U0F8R2_9BACL|nr:hypothetical protein E5161_17065 [Cohnella pontilimi]